MGTREGLMDSLPTRPYSSLRDWDGKSLESRKMGIRGCYLEMRVNFHHVKRSRDHLTTLFKKLNSYIWNINTDRS